MKITIPRMLIYFFVLLLTIGIFSSLYFTLPEHEKLREYNQLMKAADSSEYSSEIAAVLSMDSKSSYRDTEGAQINRKILHRQ